MGFIDWCFDPRNDLASPQGCWEAEQLAEEADFLGIEIDCSTWSLARRAPITSSFPHRLRRSGRYILGIPGLPLKDRLKVQKANRQVKSAVRMIRSSVSRSKQGFLENPQPSLIWGFLEKALAREIKAGQIVFVDSTLCGYGTPWRKATKVMIWGDNASSVSLKFCRCRQCCQFSGVPHVPLPSS